MKKTIHILCSISVFCLSLFACEGPSSGGDPARADIRIVVVSHGQASDPFWSVVKRGVDQAAKDMGVTVEYQAPDTFDMVAMGRLIDAAVASRPHGLVVSIPDPAALKKPIQAAIKARIPVISMNSGSDVAKEFGVLTHVGQTEYEAGFGGGEKMAASGVRKALCVNQEIGNAALDRRCQGFTDAIKKAGGSVELLAVDLADPTDSQQRVAAALSSNPDINGIMTLGPTAATPALKAIQALKAEGKMGNIHLATFDLSAEVLGDIQMGNMLFAIDQQQYLQGYLPIVMLTLYNTNLNTPGSRIIQTGPRFVTKKSTGKIIELSRQGTR